jgi:CheY-like chemotaxis protein
MRNQIKVLMIEDVETDAELALRELKRAGIMCAGRRVDTEPDLRSALTACWPDVILSDFSMPHFDGMSGLAISRELCPETPFIFLSGTIGEEYAIRALKNGASDYVLKSNLVRLPPVVERAIQDAQAQAEQKLAEQLRALEHSMTRSLAYADDASEALKAAIRSVCEIGKWDCGRYFALDQNTGKLSLSEAWGVPEEDIEKFIAMSRSRKYPPGVGLPGHILQSGEVLWTPMSSTTPGCSRWRWSASAAFMVPWGF